jgi:hypothetical protein
MVQSWKSLVFSCGDCIITEQKLCTSHYFRFNWGFFYIVIAKISMMNFISFSDVIKILSIWNKYFSWIKIWKLKLSEIHNRTKNLNCKSDKYSTGTKFLFCYYTVSTTKNEGFSTLNHMLLNLYFFLCISESFSFQIFIQEKYLFRILKIFITSEKEMKFIIDIFAITI